MNDDSVKDVLSAVSNRMPGFKKLFNDDLSSNPYGIPMTAVAALLLGLHKAKDAQYGSSWAKRGTAGVYHNVMRKKDRLFQLLERLDDSAVASMALDVAADIDNPALSDEMGGMKMIVAAALVDTLGDLANYCMMWMAYLYATQPAVFYKWLEDSWCKSTGVPYEEIKQYLDEI